MKNGQCPKCNSSNVFKHENGFLLGGQNVICQMTWLGHGAANRQDVTAMSVWIAATSRTTLSPRIGWKRLRRIGPRLAEVTHIYAELISKAK